MHTVTMVFTALGEGDPVAGDDAAGIGIFPPDALPEEIAFDHREIIGEYSRLNDR
jgi:8-oxo-dGTP diphosphatase